VTKNTTFTRIVSRSGLKITTTALSARRRSPRRQSRNRKIRLKKLRKIKSDYITLLIIFKL
jgi:hypothetical protein